MMRRLASVLLLLAPAALGAVARHHPPARTRDWTHVVTVAPNGAYVMGNPAAKAKIVEYSSMTCSHCAAFAVTGLPGLAAGYVRAGLASLEVRTALRDRFDLVASLLARCGGPGAYFADAGAIFAHQSEWLRQASDWEQANDASLAGMAMPEAMLAAAEGAGLTKLVGSGRPPARTRACLADPAQQKTLTAMADEAWNDRHIRGTPFFLVNGQDVGAADWATLEPAVRAAAGLPATNTAKE